MSTRRGRAGNFLHSIRFRLAAWFVLILGLVVTGFSVFIYTRQVHQLRSIAASRLDYQAERLIGFYRLAEGFPHGFNPTLIPEGAEPGEPLLRANDVLVLFSPEGQVVQSWGPAPASEVLQAVKLPGDPFSAQEFTTLSLKLDDGSGQKREYLATSAPIEHEHRLSGYALLAGPVDPEGQLQRLLVSLILGVASTLLVAMAGGVWLADRAMRPVKAITQTARSIGETDLNRRLNLGGKDELGELADTFDAMLARLQAAFERQRQFTADASHELRTPLTIVDLEASRALEARRPAGEYERILRTIHAENQFMIQMVNNLLTLARMDAGQIVLQSEALDLSDLALEATERLGRLAAERGLAFTLGELPALPIQGDRRLLLQMLTNLLENALKYTSQPGQVVGVESGRSMIDGQDLAWVRVSDHGPGIASEHLEHIFDRYYRVDKARTRQYETEGQPDEDAPSGTGLGLSIVQWIVAAHGGEISVQSQVGEGSTFEVRLPLTQ